MRTLMTFIVCALVISFAHAQPCKKVKVGMTTTEVLKLVGNPTEVDTLGYDTNTDGSKIQLMVWQYGEVTKDGNQRVEFSGGKVKNVIADGKKYDELIKAFQHGDIPKNEITERINKINLEACK